jgi:N4-gp56 family major capsid protein
MSRTYNDPAGGSASTIGPQLSIDHIYRKALIDLKREQYFLPLADVRSMPKHFGKKIKQFHYLPLLDERNVNDQGLDAAGASYVGGNLYGSSKDVGAISAKLPALSESGGRVNRVGFKRIDLEGTIEKFGFFDEYTKDSLDFDTDAELDMHTSREMLRGANEITEDALQIDLLNSAGTVRYPGANVSRTTIAAGDVVTYDGLVNLSIDLDQNRTPKTTKVITGTRLIDTKTVSGGRVMYIGSELIPLFKKMKDYHNNPAFIDVKHYATNNTVLEGEIGSVDMFRLVVVPEMMNFSGVGAAGIDVFPALVVGDESFTTIGFQTDGKTFKFTIVNKKPGEGVADRNDPYGETGFMSIKWFYGFMVLRPERLALFYTAAV